MVKIPVEGVEFLSYSGVDIYEVGVPNEYLSFSSL